MVGRFSKPLMVGILLMLAVDGQQVVPQRDFGSLLLRELRSGYATFDVESKNEYRMTRYNDVVSGLNQTSFAKEHQELLAQALSKLYVGIPVCSYVSSHEVQGDLFEESSESGKWKVTRKLGQRFAGELPDGWISHSKPLRSPMSPFVYIPAIPFSLAEGSVAAETSKGVTFSFPLDTLLFAHARANRWIRWLADQADWVIEISVDKERQAPRTMKFRLLEPVRKRMQYSFNSVDVTMTYSYIENCKFHAMTSLTVRIEGTAAFRGKFVEEMKDSYIDIECESPLEYLHPYTPQTNFLDHIFW